MSRGEESKSKSVAAGGGELLFVDAIEDTRARLLLGQEAFEVPRRLLPPGTREGSWVRLSLRAAPPPADEGAAIRARLTGGDDGGDIKL